MLGNPIGSGTNSLWIECQSQVPSILIAAADFIYVNSSTFLIIRNFSDHNKNLEKMWDWIIIIIITTYFIRNRHCLATDIKIVSAFYQHVNTVKHWNIVSTRISNSLPLLPFSAYVSNAEFNLIASTSLMQKESTIGRCNVSVKLCYFSLRFQVRQVASGVP